MNYSEHDITQAKNAPKEAHAAGRREAFAEVWAMWLELSNYKRFSTWLHALTESEDAK